MSLALSIGIYLFVSLSLVHLTLVISYGMEFVVF